VTLDDFSKGKGRASTPRKEFSAIGRVGFSPIRQFSPHSVKRKLPQSKQRTERRYPELAASTATNGSRRRGEGERSNMNRTCAVRKQGHAVELFIRVLIRDEVAVTRSASICALRRSDDDLRDRREIALPGRTSSHLPFAGIIFL